MDYVEESYMNHKLYKNAIAFTARTHLSNQEDRRYFQVFRFHWFTPFFNARIVFLIFCLIGFSLSLVFISHAQQSNPKLPGSIDAGRINPDKEFPDRPFQPEKKFIRSNPRLQAPPEGAENIRFILRGVEIEGNTLYSNETLQQYYSPYLNQEISLSELWYITEKITQRYQSEDYFLSRAYLPEQEIEAGRVRVNIIEGHISEVKLLPFLHKNRIVKSLVHSLTSKMPVTSKEVESFLLRLNDLPGVSITGIAEATQFTEQSGSVNLVIRKKEDGSSHSGFVTFDNFGSKFLGPYQASFGYLGRLIPYQQTRFSVSASMPTDELQSFSLHQQIPVLFPGLNLNVSASYVHAEPGYTLKPNEIKSDAYTASAGISYQLIRQRNENLSFNVLLEGKNSNSDLLNSIALTRDRIRVLRAGMSYESVDSWQGYTLLNLRVSKGLNILGSSKSGDLNLSRQEVDPDFTHFSGTYTRYQSLGFGFTGVIYVSGQISTDPLFSSEEFSYGGERLGRAYDPSELTGDIGIAGLFEVRYSSIPNYLNTSFIPFVYYDVGHVWDLDKDKAEDEASSAGFGLKFRHDLGFSASLALAFPLSRKIDVPLYGNGKNPRFIFQLGYDF